MDEHLSWKFHLSELLKKLARTYGISYKMPINVFQKKVLRAISFQPHCPPSAPTFLRTKISDLFDLKLASFVYESVHKISLVPFHNFFQSVSSVNQHSTRQASKGDIIFPGKRVFNMAETSTFCRCQVMQQVTSHR